MFSILGKITKRIASGEIPQDAVFPAKRGGEKPPKASSVRSAKGQGLGSGATRKRSGPGARTTD